MTKRIFLMGWLFFAVFVIVIAKLAYIQVYKGPIYAASSFSGRADLFPLEEASRGDILDRNGKSLLDAQIQPTLIILPKLLDDPEGFYQQFSRNFPQLSLLHQEIVPQNKNGTLVYPPTLVVPIPDTTTLHALQKEIKQGVVIAPYRQRYGDNPLAIHLLGYLDSEKKGVKGLEKLFDHYLADDHAATYLAYMSDAQRHIIAGSGMRIIDQKTERCDVVLSIDQSLQQKLEELMNTFHITRGAAVILDTHTGQILAACSRPVYTPKDLAQTYGYQDNQLERVMGEDYRYYPGSIFKLCTAVAILEENIADERTVFTCDNVPPQQKCPRPHGTINFQEALKVSCNNYFIALGEKLGREKLSDYLLNRWGFSLEVGKKLDSAASRANGIIGQELFTVSPLEMANVMVTIANDGKAFSLDDVWYNQLTLGIKENEDWLVQFELPKQTQQFSAQSIKVLQKLLRNETKVNGTSLTYAGKTGTPEIYTANGKKSYLAWYIGYAPFDEPRYAAAIVIEQIAGVPEEDLAGGKYALPFFQQLMATILS